MMPQYRTLKSKLPINKAWKKAQNRDTINPMFPLLIISIFSAGRLTDMYVLLTKWKMVNSTAVYKIYVTGQNYIQVKIF